MTKWLVATNIAPDTDGVVGVNGTWFGRDDNDEIIEFETKQDGITFLSEHDIDLNDENMSEHFWVQEKKTRRKK